MHDDMLLLTSVVIPCYNAASFIEAAIESCLAEGIPARQVIVVDDGSDDGTPQFLEGWANRITVHQKANGGASTARNAGLALTKTQYVIFLDADDMYQGGVLSALETEMLARDADLGLAPQQCFNGASLSGALKYPPETADRQAFVESWLSGRTVGTNSQMWRTAFLRRIGGWREDMHTLEEIEVVLRATLAGAVLCNSTTGYSCYVDRGNIGRVSHGNSRRIIGSAIDGLSSLEPQLNDSAQRRALGGRYYRQARAAFRQGYIDLGRDALRRARACGFRGHPGTLFHSLLAGLIGLECKERWSERLRS